MNATLSKLKQLFPPSLIRGVGLLFLIGLLIAGIASLQYQNSVRELEQMITQLEACHNSEKCYELGKELRSAAVKLGREKETATAFYYMAKFENEARQFSGFYAERAKALGKEAVEIFSSLKQPYWQAKSLLLLKEIDFENALIEDLNDLKKAIDLVKKKEENIELEERLNRLVASYHAFSNLYENDSVSKSLEIIYKGAENFLAIGRKEDAAINLRVAGNFEREMILNDYFGNTGPLDSQKVKRGLQAFSKAANLFRENSDREAVGHAINLEGDLYLAMYMIEGIPAYFDSSLLKYQQNLQGAFPYILHDVYAEMGYLYHQRYMISDRQFASDADSAEKYFEQAAINSMEKADLSRHKQTLAYWEAYHTINPDRNDSIFKRISSASLDDFSQNVARIEAQIYHQLKEYDLAEERIKARRQRRNMILISIGIGLLLVLAFFLIFQQNQLRNLQKELQLSLQLAQAKMNPHFIGNTLNSIDSLINDDDLPDGKEKASEYLVKFSRLADAILRNSDKSQISLQQELGILKNYVELERLRLNEKFEYELEVDANLPVRSLKIPPMLVQPVVENAIWHGLQHRINGYKQEGWLKINFKEAQSTAFIICEVIDNGIGRKKAAELKGKVAREEERSHSTDILAQRLSHKGAFQKGRIEIEDLYDTYGEPAGTRVKLWIPLEQN
ncbi:MAG: histidine kinase [Bacteroidia bacterium]|nr:histidine kinase [Bacteroidia bacterium]